MNDEPEKPRAPLDAENGREGADIPVSRLRIPGPVFMSGGLVLFIYGFFELMKANDESLMLWFSVTFALAPAIFIYPVMRFFFAPKTGLAVGASALFGLVVQEVIKSQINKDNK